MSKKLPFELASDETIVREEMATWIQGSFKAVLGRVYLTNRRFIFVKMNFLLIPLFGILGFLIERIWPGMNKVAFEVPLREISTFEPSQHGLNKKVILLHTSKGDQKIGVTKAYAEWETLLNEAKKRK